MSTVSLKVPALGESITEATIGLWKKNEGDVVTLDEPLVEVESEKATVEVPSPGAGVLRRIVRKSGETVAVGEVIAEIETGAQASAAPVLAAPTPAAPAPAAMGTGLDIAVKASPAMRRMMADREIAPANVAATGPAGRILREDILRAADSKNAIALVTQEPAVQGHVSTVPVDSGPRRPALTARDRVVPMSPMRRTVARRLLEAQSSAAILTTFNEVNMAEVIALRERYQEPFTKRHGIKLGFMSFFVKAAIEALKAFPSVNAEVRGNDIIYKDHYDIGVAVGGGKGLVVPVVRDADRMSLAEVERAIAELAVRAKANKLGMHDLEGGTFTISNGGIYGSMLSTPILNPPQSGILGLHAIQKRPVAVGEAIALRPMMYVALSYDHRIIDGREGVGFLVRLKECIEDPERILIEV